MKGEPTWLWFRWSWWELLAFTMLVNWSPWPLRGEAEKNGWHCKPVMKIQGTRVNETWMSPWFAWPLVWGDMAREDLIDITVKMTVPKMQMVSSSVCACIWERSLLKAEISGLDMQVLFIRTEVFGGFTYSLSLPACPDEILITQLQSSLRCSQKLSCVLGYGKNALSVMAKIWNYAVHCVFCHGEACKE